MTAERKVETEGFRSLPEQAAAVLRLNDMGGWTKAAPALYPHQWSWDSGFISIGLAHLDSGRAINELRTLFDKQWDSGKVPHIVFNPEAPPNSYFPGPEHWTNTGDFPGAPPYTSALCQPPIHAVGAWRIRELALERGDGAEIGEVDSFLAELYPKLLAWHRYLLTERDPQGSGLVTIYHPWESGTDNSPRWDAAMDAIEVGEMPGFRRRDLSHVEDVSERPTDGEYQRYIWLVEKIKRTRCHEEELQKTHPFRVKDVLMSAILVRANEVLLRIAEVVGAPQSERAEISRRAELGRAGLELCWDEEYGLYLDYDVVSEKPLRSRTVAGFGPLFAGGTDEGRVRRMLATMDSRHFLGDERLARPLPPSTSPSEARFHPRSYWRGPVWPVVSWLLWRSLLDLGEKSRADRILNESLEQISTGGFAEYFEPFTGGPLGSGDQSWTAAVVLDWCDHLRHTTFQPGSLRAGRRSES
ncbi:glucosylglycerate hydrolase [Rubrobacter indicoceani]|uniref:glucosylglycerate hydrolase n=1 Tax=Rubrobacter indicoceani TaxID=2051957 RepID=UPI0013C4859C|nr:trehalase family glycosidase [Rubrobacter indicoceani]